MSAEQAKLSDQKFLLVVIGPPGVGKTDFTRKLQEKTRCLIVSHDDIRDRYYRFFGTPQDEDDYLKRFRRPIYMEVYQEADNWLPSSSVVIDITYRFERVKEGWGDPYREIANRHNVPLFIAELYTSPEILFQRLEQRPKPPAFYDISTPEGRLRFTNDWLTKPSKLPDGYSLRIDNSGPPEVAVEQTLTFIKGSTYVKLSVA